MITDGVIVDTSVLIDFLKGVEPYTGAVENLITGKRILTTGIIMAELLQGIRNSKEEDHVAGLIEGIPVIELTTDLWVKAGKLSCSLRRKGVNLPLTDIAIATLSIELNLSIFTLDKHFEQIPGVVLYQP